MGLFDIFKKKAVAPQKTFMCARCKKEITDEETKWIGNHRFCRDCAAPPKSTSLGFSTGNVEKNITEHSSSMVRPSDVIYLEKEYAEKEIQQAKHLFTYKSDYIDERDFSHYSETEYFLTFQKKILVKSGSWTIDIHSISNNSSFKRYFYLSFEYLNKHISNYNIPEANKYLGISEENCDKFF